ncbi:lytic transglycosylase domain-containing protein [Marinobacter caseinilyticus]|uniref:lytic transglycosylase domain-containing protein n=1 Tax=Marinobacter caseinilyticus TaxID=2692195 RepID=UPI00140CC1D1|nr:lytic transglycosylase domain-containing protein [Marinobacter caseinilyticus]
MTSGTRTLLPSLAILALAFALPVMADTIKRIVHPDGSVEFTNINERERKRASSKDEVVFRYKDERGVVAYTSIQPATHEYEIIRFECYACDPNSTVNWRTTPLFRKPFRNEIKTAALEFDVDPALVRAVIHAESAFNDKALSAKGAQGLMQLMPATARELGVRDAMRAPENIRGGVNYLAKMLKRFGGDTRLATAAYNAGPGAVGRYNGIPPFAETKAYVERVGILRERYASR